MTPSFPPFFRLLSLGLLALGATSCLSGNDENTCSQDAVGSVATVSSAQTGTVGQPVTVSYTVSIPTACGKFIALNEQRATNKIYLSPTVRYEGCTCPLAANDYRGTYQFTATQPGQYILYFPSATATLTDTITIR